MFIMRAVGERNFWKNNIGGRMSEVRMRTFSLSISILFFQCWTITSLSHVSYKIVPLPVSDVYDSYVCSRIRRKVCEYINN